MKKLFQVVLLLAATRGLCFAADNSKVPEVTSATSSADGILTPVPVPQPIDEPEEPDLAFIAAGPYTQKRGSIQFVFPSLWARRRTTSGDSRRQHTEFGTLLRTERGLTDRWELDIIFAADGERNRLNGEVLHANFALSDTVLAARYRLLDESSAPFTLAMGPQVILPSGNPLLGTGFERTGYAWDPATAKDWGGPVFLNSSLTYSVFPSVDDPTLLSQRALNLHNVFWGTALGLRPVEKPRGTSHHDVHVFLEYGLGREEFLEQGPAGALKVSEVQSLIAPGVRYGLLTRTKKLIEIGISFPLGLNQNTPRGGIIVQIQFESFLRLGGE